MQNLAVVRVLHSVADIDQAVDQIAKLPLAGIRKLVGGRRSGSTCRGVSGLGLVATGLAVKPTDGVEQALTTNEAHRVKRSAIVEVPQSVNRHNAGVLKTARDFRLDDESRLGILAAGILEFDFFEGDLAVQLLIERHMHAAQPTFSMWSQNSEPQFRLVHLVERARNESLLKPRCGQFSW